MKNKGGNRMPPQAHISKMITSTYPMVNRTRETQKSKPLRAIGVGLLQAGSLACTDHAERLWEGNMVNLDAIDLLGTT